MCLINQGLYFLGPCNVLVSLRILSQMKYFKVVANPRMARGLWSPEALTGSLTLRSQSPLSEWV